MAYNYDKLYASTPDALGTPAKVFVAFFEHLDRSALRVLDVGCGQGRDALFIARLGHSVVGIDLSESGIHDLNDAARKENLLVKGVVADATTFSPEGEFDVLLIDRTLHMLPEKERLQCLARLIDCVACGGWVLIADERSNMSGFKGIFEADKVIWEIHLEDRGYLFLHR